MVTARTNAATANRTPAPAPPPPAPASEPAPVGRVSPSSPRVPALFSGRLDLTDRRNLIGLGVMAFCLGVMVGARIMRGAVPPMPAGEPTVRTVEVPTAVPGPVVYVKGDECPECAERRIRDERERAAVAAGQQPSDESGGAARTFSPHGPAAPE